MTENDTPPETPANPEAASAASVDLSSLRMMPAWVSTIGAGESTSTGTDYSRFEEREDRGPRRGGGGFGDRGDRRGPPTGRRDGPPPRRDGPGGGFGGPRPAGPGAPGPRGGGDSRPPRRDGPPGGRPPGAGGGDRDRDQRGGPRRFGDRDRDQRGGPPQREWVEIPKDVQVVIEPEDKSAEALASHIRSTGHAFSMFDAARLVLAEGDRFHARYQCASDRSSGLFATNDGGLFLTRDEAVQHVLRGKALDAFYRSEEIELEEPKGDFKSIGVCGFSGELLGPPSHHSFQTSIIRLHRERFANMPLEDYKRRVRVDTTPERVAEWKEKQKKGFRWVWLKDAPAEGAEPQSFSSRAEVEAHFRRFHADEAVTEKRDALVIGNVDKNKLTHVLFIMLRHAVENARKHLFDMSQKLGASFERRGLKLFKRRAGKLFVSRVKPRAVDPGVVFSERVSKLVEMLKGKTGILLHDLVESIVPSPAPAEAAPAAEGEAAAAPVKHAPTDEQITVIKDIRWLANEGYVIEYSDGMVFLGVQGEPQGTPKAAAAPASAPAAAAANAEASAETSAEVESTEAKEAAAEPEAAPTAESEPAAEVKAVEEELATAADEAAATSEPAPAPAAEAEAEATPTEVAKQAAPVEAPGEEKTSDEAAPAASEAPKAE